MRKEEINQVIGRREKLWLREDGWLQKSEATGGQDVPLLVGACWRTGHDAGSVCVRVHVRARVCVFVCQSLLKHICRSNRHTGPTTRIQIFHDHLRTASKPQPAQPSSSSYLRYYNDVKLSAAL